MLSDIKFWLILLICHIYFDICNTISRVLFSFLSARYLGDQRFSYNQFLSFSLRIGEETASASIIDIIIEGSGQRISIPFYYQNNPTPGVEKQEFRFRLNEHPDYQWYPKLTSEAFISILANVTAIKIRGTYNENGKKQSF